MVGGEVAVTTVVAPAVAVVAGGVVAGGVVAVTVVVAPAAVGVVAGGVVGVVPWTIIIWSSRDNFAHIASHSSLVKPIPAPTP